MSEEDRRPINRSAQGTRPTQAGARPTGARPTQTGARPTGARPTQEGARPTGARPTQAGARPTGARPTQEGARPTGARPTQEGARPTGTRPTQAGSYPSSSSSARSSSSKPVRRTAPKKKSSAGKIILFVAEIAVLAVMVVILWTVLKTEKVGKADIAENEIVINEEVAQKIVTQSNQVDETGEEIPSPMTGYRNIALFGVDSREGALNKNTRSDTIIIASINEQTKEVKLCSVYRDTYLNLGNDQYNKCNAAYAKGGPVQAINMLNMNLDMNITDFITIGFEGLTSVIDSLGGVEIEVTESEIVHLNNYQISMVGKTTDGETFTANEGVDYTPVTHAGLQTLNGLQATAYCRIRYVGSDFQRTERQRKVIMALLEKAKQNPTKLPAIADAMFDKVYTSLDLSEIVNILGDVSKYNIVDQAGFPQTDMLGTGNIGAKGSCVVPTSLYDNVKWIHKFLFSDENYEPSNSVKTYSDQIHSDTASYL